MGNKKLTADLTKRAIRRAEYEFTEVIKIDKDVLPKFQKSGWDMSNIYLEDKTNRFMVQQ